MGLCHTPSLGAAPPVLASRAPKRRQLQLGSTRKECNEGPSPLKIAPTPVSQAAEFQAPYATPAMNSGLFILCATKRVAVISGRDAAAALNPHNTPPPLCTLIPDAQPSPQAMWLGDHVSIFIPPPDCHWSWTCFFCMEFFAVVCNRTFISGFSLVQSKLILLADFSTVSGGSYGTLSMLLALMMHNTNPSLEQECPLMMD